MSYPLAHKRRTGIVQNCEYLLNVSVAEIHDILQIYTTDLTIKCNKYIIVFFEIQPGMKIHTCGYNNIPYRHDTNCQKKIHKCLCRCKYTHIYVIATIIISGGNLESDIRGYIPIQSTQKLQNFWNCNRSSLSYFCCTNHIWMPSIIYSAGARCPLVSPPLRRLYSNSTYIYIANKDPWLCRWK